MTKNARALVLIALTGCVAACSMKEAGKPAAGGPQGLPNVYAPNRSQDPNARTQWEAGVSALERECERTRRFCEEARQGRAALNSL